MKKKILAIAMMATLALSVVACGTDSKTSNKEKEKTESNATNTKKEAPKEVTYQSILDEYSQKIKDAAPGLVEEYNTESAEKAGDVNALAELSNAKIAKLAEICNAGVEEMAKIKLKNGDDDAKYSEWAGKLQSIYTEQAQLITDAYTSSAS